MSTAIISAFYSVCLLLTISIAGRFALSLAGQSWVKTFSHTATLTVLPLVTFVITKVISGNIALSLGMVGALSIIRFRNPVKSPFELSIYFAFITMGIAASVSIKWLLFLTFSLSVAFCTLMAIDFIFRHFLGKEFFMTSFSEGNSLSTLTINSNETIDMLVGNEKLVSMSKMHDNFNYVLASNNIDELKGYLVDIQEVHELTDYRITK